MGGWCRKRESCRLYQNNKAPIVHDRLCDPGETDAYEPIRFIRSAGTWERPSPSPGLLAPATWLDAVH